MQTRMKNFVTQVPAAPSPEAERHYQAKFTFETDCWDVHSTEDFDDRGFVLVDVRSPELYAKGHLQGAINIPHAKLTEKRLEEYAMDTLFVVYCSGPHCNGSTRGALRLAQQGRPVKEMIGGVTGWIDEGFTLVTE